MAIIVQKYGGTSVGSLSRIESVAENVIVTVRKGHQVVVVLSAMSGETNRLLSLAHQLDSQPATRELDMLMATGEQVSISLLAIALVQRGFSAISLLAHQIGIKTDNHFGRARIKSIDTKRLTQALEQEQIVIVAGFQGQDLDNNVTTLGRGGSDTSAVAVASALRAQECQIYTDVNGVYSADPRIVGNATRLHKVSFEEMLVMANLGAKVLQNRAVEYAYQHDMPLRVLSSFTPDQGTLVLNKNNIAELDSKQAITSLAQDQHAVLMTITGIFDINFVSQFFELTSNNNIELDMVNSFQQENGQLVIKMMVNKADSVKFTNLLDELTKENSSISIQVDDKIGKISAIGVGIKSDASIVNRFIATLADEKISVKLMSTSEIHISAVIDEAFLITAMNKLHSTFGLDLSK